MTLLAGCSLQLHYWLILGGDFNCGGIDWSCDHQYGNSLNACEQALFEVSDKYGLSQHVHSTTRPYSSSLLDLVFASYPTVIQACHVLPGTSDHDAVLFEVNVSPRCPPKPPQKILQYHKADFDGLRSHLSFCLSLCILSLITLTGLSMTIGT